MTVWPLPISLNYRAPFVRTMMKGPWNLKHFGTDAGRNRQKNVCTMFRAGSCAEQAPEKIEKRPFWIHPSSRTGGWLVQSTRSPAKIKNVRRRATVKFNQMSGKEVKMSGEAQKNFVYTVGVRLRLGPCNNIAFAQINFCYLLVLSQLDDCLAYSYLLQLSVTLGPHHADGSPKASVIIIPKERPSFFWFKEQNTLLRALWACTRVTKSPRAEGPRASFWTWIIVRILKSVGKNGRSLTSNTML